MGEYKSQITKEQSAQLKQQKQQLNGNKNLALEKEELKLLGKPKHPAGAFVVFANELRRSSPTKISRSDISAKWKALSESERNTYSDRRKKALEQFK